jgi:hypothetical protein
MHPLDDNDLSAVRGGIIGALMGGGMGGGSMLSMIPQLIGAFSKGKGQPQQQTAAQQAVPQAPTPMPQQAMGGGDTGEPRVSVEISQGVPLSGMGSTTTRTV